MGGPSLLSRELIILTATNETPLSHFPPPTLLVIASAAAAAAVAASDGVVFPVYYLNLSRSSLLLHLG